MRYAQNIVGLILQLGEAVPGYSDAQAKQAWIKDPILVPLRETLELISSSSDWVEIIVAVDLVLEPIVGTLVKSEFLARNAPYNGDPATPLILASERADAARHLECATTLINVVCADADHGAENRKLVRGWLDKWTAKTEQATKALKGHVPNSRVLRQSHLSRAWNERARTNAWHSKNSASSGEIEPIMSSTKTQEPATASATSGKSARNKVGISLMVTSDTEAIVEVTRKKYPDAKIDFRDCFYKIERDDMLDWNMEEVGEQIGRPYDTDLFLVNMSSIPRSHHYIRWASANFL